LKKTSLNDTLANIIIFITVIALIGGIITFVIIWEKTNNLWSVFSGVLINIALILNIYNFKKIKDKKEV